MSEDGAYVESRGDRPLMPAIVRYFAADAFGLSKYRLANVMNLGQVGAGVWPAVCCRNPRSPSLSAGLSKS